MKTKSTTKMLIITTTLFFLMGGSIAFAQGGWGYNDRGGPMRGYGGHMMGSGYGGGPMMGYGYGKGFAGSRLTEEQAAELSAAQEKFYQGTKDLRDKLYEKRRDLRDEMVKENPDAAKVSKIQKELSALKADFDQKRLQHRLEVRKIAPEKFQERGFGRGFGRGGFGRGGGYCR